MTADVRCRRRSTFRRWTTRRRRQQDSGHVHLTLLLREGNGGHVEVDAAAAAAEVAVELSDQVVVELRQSRPLSCSGDATLKNNRVVVGLTGSAHRSKFSMAPPEMRNLIKIYSKIMKCNVFYHYTNTTLIAAVVFAKVVS